MISHFDMTATRAMFVEFQQVKTRGVYKLVFELDETQADQALQALGGLPQGKESRWCGICLLDVRGSTKLEDAVNSGSATAGDPKQSAPETGQQTLEGGGGTDHKPRRHFHELSRREQAVLLCKDARFQNWVAGQAGIWATEDNAADFVRNKCAVTSRTDLGDNEGGYRFDCLHAKYLADTGQAAEPR